MSDKEILRQMFALQQKLNNETNGKGWESGYTNKDKIINWKRCIYMECAELIDSFAWKHWKSISSPTDWDNVKVEVVDIWHFIMSLILEYYKNNHLGDIDKIVDDISDTKIFKSFCKSPAVLSEKNNHEIMNDAEELIHVSTGFNKEMYQEILDNYFLISIKCGVNLSELYKFYVAKNVLNKFRQDNGYKEGNYKKVWNGKEDNEVMLSILSGDKSIEQIYKELELAYKEVK